MISPSLSIHVYIYIYIFIVKRACKYTYCVFSKTSTSPQGGDDGALPRTAGQCIYGRRGSIHHHPPEAISEANVLELTQKRLYTDPSGWW